MSDDKTEATFHGSPDFRLGGPGYNQGQLHVQHGWDYPPSAEADEHDGLLTQPSRVGADKTFRRRLIVALTVVSILTGLTVIALFLQLSNVLPVGVPVIGKDSGLAACEELAAGTKPTGQNESITADQYKKLRQVFSESRYPEIGKPGVKMVDLAWQFQRSDNKDDLGAALMLVGPMTQAYSELAGGCAEHDVVIPALGS